MGGRLALALQLVGGVLTLSLLILGLRSSAAEARARKAAVVQAVAAHDLAVAAHDQVEPLFAEAILGSIRHSDVACRYGGEELTVLLPDSTLEEALAKAEVLRGRIEALSEVHGTRITASLGVAAFPDTSTNVRGLVALADAALYEAKKAGRNRVVPAGRGGKSGRRFSEAPLIQAAE